MKQIIVDSAITSGAMNDAFVRVEKIDIRNGIKAKLRIQVQTPNGAREKSVTVKNEYDLYELSKNRAQYKDGFVVTEIDGSPGAEFVKFNGGLMLRLGEEHGGVREDVWRAQIQKPSKSTC